MTPPYSTLILAMFPLDQIGDVRINVSRHLALFGLEIIFEVCIPTYVIKVPEHHGWTERQTT